VSKRSKKAWIELFFFTCALTFCFFEVVKGLGRTACDDEYWELACRVSSVLDLMIFRSGILFCSASFVITGEWCRDAFFLLRCLASLVLSSILGTGESEVVGGEGLLI
jgi:hypothetical protein